MRLMEALLQVNYHKFTKKAHHCTALISLTQLILQADHVLAKAAPI